MTRELLVFPKRRRYIGLFLQALVMTGLAIFCLLAHHFDFDKPARLAILLTLLYPIFWLGLGLFSFGAVFSLLQAARSKSRPLLIVNEQGITDQSSLIALGFLPWEAIDTITLKPYLGQTFLSVSLKDNNRYLSKMNWFQKQACQANLKLGFPLVNIVLTASDQTTETVYQTILTQFGEYIKK